MVIVQFLHELGNLLCNTFAPASKLVAGVSPFLKVPAEMLLGRTVFPDLRAPRELRDPARHLANVWRLEDVYDVVRGRPSREPAGTLPWFRSMVFERRSAGEKSYHTIRALAFDWKKRVKGSDVKVIVKSEGADDVYYYRQALRLGQKDVAARYLARIEAAAERTGKSVRRVVAQANANADVLSLLPKRWRAEFIAGLTKKERAHLAQARDWKEALYEDAAPAPVQGRPAPPRRVAGGLVRAAAPQRAAGGLAARM